MKASIIALLVSLPVIASAGEVRRGDSVGAVVASLGEPRGQMSSGDRTVFLYDRGRVEFVGDAVARVSLRSEDEQRQLDARRAAEAARIRDENAIRESRLRAEGEALKAAKLADPSFQNAPVAYQVGFWEDFARKYPGVPSGEPLAIARMRLEQEQARQQEKVVREERLAELEARVTAAEARAADAESRVRHRDFGSGAIYGERYPFTFWPVRYHFGSTSSAPYSVPAGNPAGSPVFPLRIQPPAQHPSSTECRDDRDGDSGRHGRSSDWRGNHDRGPERGRHGRF